MQTSNAELMRSARESLRGKWGISIGVVVVYFVIVIALRSVKDAGPIAALLVTGPFAGGLAAFFLTVARGAEPRFDQLFDGFKRFTTYFVAHILMTVFILLWTLLLIVPGILAALSYSMTYFIIADEPTISAMDALKRSKDMMKGNRGTFFGLQLRFLGWSILSLFTLGIGFLWLFPYMQTSIAKFYDDLKGTKVGSDVVAGSEVLQASTPEPSGTAPVMPAAKLETDSVSPFQDSLPTSSADVADTGAKPEEGIM